jgi:uncharacterized protein with von Willebrand factor type A (vWA) domain
VADPVDRLVEFARRLRGEGIAVGPGRVIEFCRAAALLPADGLYWAGRATLLSRPEDAPVYDRIFSGIAEEEPLRVRLHVAEEELAPASDEEQLRDKSFSQLTDGELTELAALMRRVELGIPLRRSRRREAARSGSPDLRRTLRRSFRTGGDPLELAWKRRRRQRRRLVVVLDISGSMADYSRALLVFAHAALRADARWEAFAFGTRLTRLTPALAASDADEALARASEDIVDWSGGTRIGESLKHFLDEYGHGGLARGAVVVLCSDGLEVGDPELLAEQMARLSRLAHRIVWLNPLQEDPAYEPLARGMQAALPYVDVFASGHNLASLEELGRSLGG